MLLSTKTLPTLKKVNKWCRKKLVNEGHVFFALLDENPADMPSIMRTAPITFTDSASWTKRCKTAANAWDARFLLRAEVNAGSGGMVRTDNYIRGAVISNPVRIHFPASTDLIAEAQEKLPYAVDRQEIQRLVTKEFYSCCRRVKQTRMGRIEMSIVRGVLSRELFRKSAVSMPMLFGKVVNVSRADWEELWKGIHAWEDVCRNRSEVLYDQLGRVRIDMNDRSVTEASLAQAIQNIVDTFTK